MKVLIESFSRFYDAPTKTEFTPTLNRQTGCFVGIADVQDAAPFENRSAFRILTDEQFLALSEEPKAPEPKADPEAPEPLAAAAKSKTAPKPPPAPPASK